MSFSLIDQFCQAIELWAAKTSQSVSSLTDWSFFHSGGPGYIRLSGDVPGLDTHKLIPFKHGSCTIEQLRQHLNALVNQGMLESTLICGLVRAVDVELTHLAVYQGMVDEYHRKIETLNYLYKHFGELPFEEIEAYKEALEEAGSDRPFNREFFKDLADIVSKFTADPDNNEAEMKFWLSAWREVSAPIVQYQNLHSWLMRYLYTKKD